MLLRSLQLSWGGGSGGEFTHGKQYLIKCLNTFTGIEREGNTIFTNAAIHTFLH